MEKPCENCGCDPAEYMVQDYALCIDCARDFLGFTPAEVDRVEWKVDGALVYALTPQYARGRRTQANRFSLQVQGGGEVGLTSSECVALARQIAELPAILQENARLRARIMHLEAARVVPESEDT